MEEKIREISYEELLNRSENYLVKGDEESFWWLYGNPNGWDGKNTVELRLDKEGKFIVSMMTYEEGKLPEGESYWKHFSANELEEHEELQYLKCSEGRLSSEIKP